MKGVLGVIRRDGLFLLGTESKNTPLKGKWRLLGGKLEEGESAERALIRELNEEAGISIRVVNHLGTRKGSINPMDIDVLLAEHTQGGLVPNEKEIGELKYFTYDEILALDIDRLSRQIIEDFCKRR